MIKEIRRASHDSEILFCATGQHREMFDQVLRLFGLETDVDLNVMTPNQALSDVTAVVLQRMTDLLKAFRPDWVVVQGDTTTTMATALAAFYLQLSVAHVEAGLRTNDRFHPFPEEVNRKVTDAVSELLFAPTDRAAENLRTEGFEAGHILVTGNTGIDALLQVADMPQSGLVDELLAFGKAHRLVLVTTHRRENFGEPLERICGALRVLADRFPDVRFIVPVHRNPNVGASLRQALGDHPAFRLTEPLDYSDFVAVMKQSYLILTDSGGVQEEAPSLGKPVLVLRERTERQEAVDAGTARLVGTDPRAIVDETSRLLLDADAYRAMAHTRNPFGDGHASRRIVAALQEAGCRESAILGRKRRTRY